MTTKNEALINDAWCREAARAFSKLPKAEQRQGPRILDTELPHFFARVSTDGVTLSWRAKDPGQRTAPERRWGVWDQNELPASKVRKMHQDWLILKRAGAPVIVAYETVKAANSKDAGAATLRQALDSHADYLERYQSDGVIASALLHWPDRRKRIEAATRAVLDEPFSLISGSHIVASLAERRDRGAGKSAFNLFTHIMTLVRLNKRTHALPVRIAKELIELKPDFPCPKSGESDTSIRTAPRAKIQTAWDEVLGRAHDGTMVVQLAAIITGLRRAELVRLTGSMFTEYEGLPIIAMPGQIMKGQQQADPKIAAKRAQHIYRSPRFDALIRLHREAAGVPLNDGPVFLAAGKSQHLPKQSLAGMDPTYLARRQQLIKKIAGLEDWGQQVSRRTYTSVAATAKDDDADHSPAALISNALRAAAIESQLNHRVKGLVDELTALTRRHYLDRDAKIARQVKSSLIATSIVEAWIAEMLGETGDNVTSLDGVQRKAT